MKEEISDKTIWKIVKEKAFAEATIRRNYGKMALLNEERRAVIHRKSMRSR
ncbi:MAG: hypothetical protein ACLRWM_01050 [Streptococcus sp.]